MPDRERRQQADQVAEEDAEDADVEQVRSPAQLPGAQQLRRVALPRVLVAVEAHQAADEEDRQGDIGIDSEQELVEVGHRVAPLSRHARRGMNCITAVGGAAAPQPGAPAGPKITGSSTHSSSIGFSVGGRLVAAARREPRLADHRQQPRRSTARSRCRGPAAPRRPRAGCARSRRASPSPRPAGRCARYSSTAGRKSGSSFAGEHEPGARVDLLQVHHRLAAVARVAVDVLEQVQRRRAAAVEQRDVALLHVEEVGRCRARAASARSASCAARASRGSRSTIARDLGQRGDEVRRRVGEQRGQRLVGDRHGHALA